MNTMTTMNSFTSLAFPSPTLERVNTSLSESSERVLRFIRDYFRTAESMPTVREIMRYMGFRSTNAVYKHIQKLQKEGKICKNARGRLALCQVNKPL